MTLHGNIFPGPGAFVLWITLCLHADSAQLYAQVETDFSAGMIVSAIFALFCLLIASLVLVFMDLGEGGKTVNKSAYFATVVIVLVSLICQQVALVPSSSQQTNESATITSKAQACFPYQQLPILLQCLEMSELQEEIRRVSETLQKCGGGRFQFRLRLQYCGCGYKQCRSCKYQQ